MRKQILIALAAIVMIATGCCGQPNEKSCSASCEECTCKTMQDKDSLLVVMNIPFKIKPEYVSAFITSLNKCAVETLKEEGCLDYTLYQSPTDSTSLYLVEAWENKRVHNKHMTMDHLKLYFQEIKGMTEPDPTRKTNVYYICPKLNP